MPALRWLRRPAASPLLALLFALPVAGAPLERGDLLVTDYHGGRVVRVDRTGAVETFSPPPGGTNLLSGPLGVTVVDDGPVFVVDVSENLVEIDRDTGVQSFAQHSSGLAPVDIGSDPYGITHFQGPTELALYVSSRTGLVLVAPNLDFGGFDRALLSATPTTGRGLAVRPNASGLAAEEIWVGTRNEGMWRWRPGPGAEQILPPDDTSEAGDAIHDIDFTRDALRAPVFTRVGFLGPGGCAPGTGGVFAAVLGVGPISQGGLLRCPLGVVLVPGRAEIYVTETGTIGPSGDGRIVRLASAGAGIWTQSLFVDAATLGVSLPAGLAFVPEPTGGALGGAALAALGLLAWRRAPWRRRAGLYSGARHP